MNSIGFDLQESLHLLLLLLFQVVEDGYEFFAKRQLVTLFSAPNYCGEFDNAGGMMSVDDSLMCSFQVGGERYSLFTLLIFVCYGTVELDQWFLTGVRPNPMGSVSQPQGFGRGPLKI